jgi:LuxR family transcriptional regulator, maltose regulon positive regulatory protein
MTNPVLAPHAGCRPSPVSSALNARASRDRWPLPISPHPGDVDRSSLRQTGGPEQLWRAQSPFNRLRTQRRALSFSVLAVEWHGLLDNPTSERGQDMSVRSNPSRSPNSSLDLRPEPGLVSRSEGVIRSPLASRWLDDPLVAAKVTRPTRRSGTVMKGDLAGVLVAQGPAVVAVTAPAGYGKTTLMVEWAQRDPRRSAWASLDGGDKAPEGLLGTLARAIEQLGPVDPAVYDELSSPGGSILGQVVPRLVRTLRACDEPFLVLIDDLHEVDDQHCRDALNLVADYWPQGSTLVVSSRSEIWLDLARRRVSGGLVEIGPEQLAFSVDEAAQLLAAAGVDRPADVAETLVRRTEGWPAGLYLAALALQGGTAGPDGPDLIAGNDRFVADYLRTEILDRVPDGIRRFLIRSSILEQMCGPLSDQTLASSGSAAILASLARSNMFVVRLDQRSEWYRYHGLFREMLRAELARDEPDLVVELHRRAADWYGSHGRLESAIDHARASGDIERTARLLLRYVPSAFTAEQVSAAARGLGDLTDAVIERHPLLAVYAAWIAILTGRPVEASRWANIAEQLSSAEAPLDGSPSFESGRALLTAALCAHGIAKSVADAEFAAAAEPPWSPWRCQALRALFEARMLEGKLDDAETALAEWLETAPSTNHVTLSRALTERSLLAIARGDWDLAAVAVTEALTHINALGRQEHVISSLTYASAARTAAERHDLHTAREQLAHALRLRPQATWVLPRLAVVLRLELAGACLALADPGGARTMLREIDLILQHRPELGALLQEVDGLRQRVGVAADTLGVSTLSAAELRLIPYLQTHLTNAEIAERLYVSTNTVKSELKSIYRKLEVSTRHEAIERARAVGLLAR